MATKPVAGKLARQFVSFTLVGLAGLAVDAGVFVLLTRTFLPDIVRRIDGSGAVSLVAGPPTTSTRQSKPGEAEAGTKRCR